jgi:predicted lipid-binding transport protein (Tim44 family)
MVEWSRRLADFAAKGWHNVVEITGPVQIEYVGLVNRADDAEDRVVVRVSAVLEDYVRTRDGGRMNHVGVDGSTATIREYWTLRFQEGRWRLVSIEQDREGEHHLRSEIVADPADDGALADEAMVEQAMANRVTAGTKIAELADLDFDGDALTAARDLSLVDQRFDPGVIEVSARRAVAAWAEAVDGPDDALLELAGPEVVRTLLYPTGHDNERLVVRGPRAKRIHVGSVDAAATPPAIRIAVVLEGVRFLEDRDTVVVVAGSNRERTEFVEWWTLTLDDGSTEDPWRLAAAVPAAL